MEQISGYMLAYIINIWKYIKTMYTHLWVSMGENTINISCVHTLLHQSTLCVTKEPKRRENETGGMIVYYKLYV